MIVATELTPERFVKGRRRALRGDVHLEWLAVDAENLTFEDERFDYVLSSLGVQSRPAMRLSPRNSSASASPNESS
jgi:ubiquinone/menaquinone biosynthesis C-methylase UbiE